MRAAVALDREQEQPLDRRMPYLLEPIQRPLYAVPEVVAAA